MDLSARAKNRGRSLRIAFIGFASAAKKAMKWIFEKLSQPPRSGVAIPGRFDSLDGLRVVAALMVFFLHLKMLGADIWEGFFGEFFWLYDLGHPAVDLFFVLSAFLLTLRLRDSHDLKGYFIGRARRILPAYYLSVSAVFIFCFLVVESDLYLPLSFEFLKHLVLLGGVTTQAGAGVNEVYWSLSVEAFIYLSLPWLVRLFFVRPVVTLIAAYVVSAGWRIFVYSTFGLNPTLGLFFPAQLFNVAVGIGAAWLWVNGFELRRFWLAVLVFCLFTSFLPSGGTEGLYWFPVTGLICGWVLMASCTSARFLHFSRSAWVKWLSEMSYGFYLWHAFLLYVLIAYGVTNMLLDVLVVMPTALLIAWGSRKWIELRFLSRQSKGYLAGKSKAVLEGDK